MAIVCKNYTNVSPRFSETDMMNVIHHAAYWSWFEESRFAFLQEVLGVSTKDIESSLLMMPVISCACNYIRKIKWGEDIQISTRLEVNNAPYLVFHHEIYFSSDYEHKNLLCRAWIKQAFVDQSFNLKLKMPSFLSESIEKNLSEMSYAFIEEEEIMVRSNYSSLK